MSSPSSSPTAGFTANLDLFSAAAAEVAGIHNRLESAFTDLKAGLESLGNLPWTDDGAMDATGEKFRDIFLPASRDIVAAGDSITEAVGGIPQALKNARDSYQRNEESAQQTLG